MLINRKNTLVEQPTATQSTRHLAVDWRRWDLGPALFFIIAWLAVIAGGPLWLPDQAAAWLTFAGLFITPGLLLGDMATRRLDLDPLERLALAFPLGIALLALPGMTALLLHWTITTLALGWMIASTAVVVVWLVWTGRQVFVDRNAASAGKTARTPWRRDEIMLLFLLALAFALLIPTLTLYKIDGDAYAVNSFAADALAGLPLNQHEPLFGEALGPGVRMVFNQSLPMAYLWSHFSGIEPNVLTAVGSRAPIALLAILAAYMLGRAAGVDLPGPVNGRRFGLLVAWLQLLVYAAAPFLRGDNVSLFFFERTTADKFMVPVTMLPVIFALVMIFLRSGAWGAWAAAALAAFAVSAIHPLIAAMLALGLGSFAGVHFLVNLRKGDPARLARLRVLFVGGLIAVTMCLPLVQLVLARGEEPLAASYPRSLEEWPVGYRMVPALPFVHVPTLDVYGPLPELSQLEAEEVNQATNPFLIWRFAVNMERRRLLLFSLDYYISDPNIILEPVYLLAFLLLPLLIPGVRRRLGAQFALGAAGGILFVMFNPVVTPLIGSLVMPWILWRFVWLLPYALILALAAAPGLNWAAKTLDGLDRRGTHHWGRYTVVVATVAVTALLSPMIVRNLAMLQDRAAYPYYFPTPDRLLSTLDELTRSRGAATVMADQDLSVSIPAYVAKANIVAHRAPTTSEVFPADQQDKALQRLIDQADFFRSRYLTADTLAILRRYDVGYIVATSGSNLDIQLRLAPEWFTWVLDDQSYSLYIVETLPETNATIRGNSALAQRQWDDAAAEYAAALDEQPGDLLALVGLADIAHARGRFGEALNYIQQAMAEADLPVLHYKLGQLHTQLGQIERAVVEFDTTQAKAPNVARFHVAAGDACLAVGDEACAAEQYGRAAASRNLPDQASELILLADLWRQRNRADEALARYEQAAALQPSLVNQLMLASAYFEEQHFDEANALLRLLRMGHPFSIEARTLAAEVAAAQGDVAQALSLYRRAIWVQNVTGQESAETHLALVRTLIDAGRITEAQRELDRVLALQPNNAVAYALQGDIHSALHDANAATVAYQKAFRLDPTQVQLYLALSNQFREMGGQRAELLNLLQTAIRANPDEATLALALGDQLQRQGETAEAIDAYQAALDRFELTSLTNSLTARGSNTSRAYAYIRLAAVSEDLGQTEPAMNYYSAAVAAAPDVPWTHVMYGDALRRRNKVAEAEDAYRRAIANDAAFANAYVQLAELLRAGGNSIEADLLQEQALAAAFEQAAAPRIARVQPGLSKQTPAGELANQFSPTDEAEGSQSERNQAERLLGELDGQGDDLFAVADGLSVLDLLTRLVQSTGDIDRAIDLFQRGLEQGQREGWASTVLAQYHKGLGDLYLAQGLPMLAVDAYRSAVALDSWWPQAQLGLARALEATGQVELAQAQLEDAVAAAPGFVEAQVALAEFYERIGDSDGALALYRQTAANHPGNPRATLALAQAYQSRHQWDEAERAYQRTIALTPGNSDAYVDFATLLIAQARYQEAEPMLLAALETDQENMNAHIQMGVLAQQQGNVEEAVDWFKRAVRVRPAGQPVNLVLIDLLQRYGHYDLSLGYVAEALAQQPTDLEMILRQARAQRLVGRTGDALATLLEAARLNLADAALSAELGEVYRAQGRPEAALAAYRQTVALEPAEDAYYIRLAGLWQSLAMVDEAEAILRSGLTKANDPATLYAALADLYLRSGRATDARTLLENALDLLGQKTILVTAMGAFYEAQAVQGVAADDSAERWYLDYLADVPQDAEVVAALGDHYLRRDQTEAAIAQFEQVVAWVPTDAGAHVALADAYAAAKRNDDAAAALRQAILLEPTLAEAYRELASIYRDQNKPELARNIYLQGLNFAPTDGSLYIAYTDFLIAQGQSDEANVRLAQADQVAPTVEMLLARAELYNKLKRTDEALRDLQAARQKQPGSLDVLLALGDLYRDMGNTEQAQAVYAEATKLSPGLAAGRVRLARLAR